ncbi:hypothetical protein Tco_0464694 [Tanacetum coccineum]
MYDILKKFGFSSVKTASTPMETHKPLSQDIAGTDVDVHLYRSMIGSLMYLTSYRTDIMFTVCACSRFQVQPKASHMHAVKRIFRYLKGQPILGLWYPKDSPMDLIAYSDSDYVGASIDRKSTTGGCQFLGCRLISWQCKKQTIMANSTTKVEYIAASNCCGQVVVPGAKKPYWGCRCSNKSTATARTSATGELEDNDGVTTLPNSEIFKKLALIGYATNSNKLTFQKGHFSPQWRFFIHTILHCLSPKKTDWDQFSSNIATAIICLATTRTFNFSKFIFDTMVKNLDNPHKFLMYPRFIQICLNKQRRLLQPHTRTYSTHVLTQKVFSNMKRVTKGYSGEDIPLFASMITASETSPSRITSSPSLSPQHTPFTAPSTSQPSNIHTTPVTEEAASMPHESPLQSVHSLGRDEGSLSLHELTVLCTNLSNKVTSLEAELAQTKQTYGTALTKLIKKVKKLEQTVKTSQSRRRTRVVLSDEEEVSEDPSKQGRSLIEELDLDAKISLVHSHDVKIQENISDDTEVTIADSALNTASVPLNTASVTPEVSTAAANLVYIRRSAEKRKDKGKAIMIEDESVQKKSKKQLEQERLSHEEAIRLQEQIDEDERKRIARDAKIAKQLQEGIVFTSWERKKL